MKFKAKKTDLGLGIWEIIVDSDLWQQFLANAKTTLIKNINIPGFRKGKAPLDMALKNINQIMILKEASRVALKKCYNFALTQITDIKPISQIEPEIIKLSINECIINYNFDINLEININKYKGFNLPVKKVEVTKKDLDNELNKLIERFTILETKNGKVADGDTVIIDFDGKIDNKKFPGGEAKNYSLDIGSNSFIDGFEKSLIGWTVNTKKNINLKFPDNYHVENLREKNVNFEVNLKEIKSKKIPKLSDELIQDLNIKNIDNLEQYKIYITKELEKELMVNEKNRVIDEILDSIIKESNIIIPHSIIINQTKHLFKSFEQKVKSQNLTVEEYCKRTGLTLKNINSELMIDAIKSLKNYYILNHIKINEKINIEKEDIENKYKTLANSFSLDISDPRIKQYFPEDKIIIDIETEKITNFLYINN